MRSWKLLWAVALFAALAVSAVDAKRHGKVCVHATCVVSEPVSSCSLLMIKNVAGQG